MADALLAVGRVLAVGAAAATVRVWLAAGGVVEVNLPAVGLALLQVGDTVVGFAGEAPESGVVLVVEGGRPAARRQRPGSAGRLGAGH